MQPDPREVTGLKDFRDPHVVMGPDGLWKMTIAGRNRRGGVILLYETRDPAGATGWTFVCELYQVSLPGPGPAECPCLLPLGDSGLWVLITSLKSHDKPTHRRNLSLAVTGRFDGKSFEVVDTKEVDYGTDCYAFQAFNDPVAPIGIGWAANWAEIAREEDFLTTTTLMRKLEWRGDHLATPVVDAVTSLRVQKIGSLVEDAEISLGSGLAELDLMFDRPGVAFRIDIDIDIDGEPFGFSSDGATMEMHHFAGEGLPFYRVEGQFTQLRVFIDVGLIEIYVDDGRWCFTKRLRNWVAAKSVRFAGERGALKRADVWELKPISCAPGRGEALAALPNGLAEWSKDKVKLEPANV